jgi:hypothetical protein
MRSGIFKSTQTTSTEAAITGKEVDSGTATGPKEVVAAATENCTHQLQQSLILTPN